MKLVSGVGGAATTGMTHVESFNWYGIEINDTDLMTMKLSKIRNSRGTVGVIGYNVLKNCRLLLIITKRRSSLSLQRR